MQTSGLLLKTWCLNDPQCNFAAECHWRQFIGLKAASSRATKGFMLLFHTCSRTPQDLQTHINVSSIHHRCHHPVRNYPGYSEVFGVFTNTLRPWIRVFFCHTGKSKEVYPGDPPAENEISAMTHSTVQTALAVNQYTS